MEVPSHVHLDALLQQGDATAAPDERPGLHYHFAVEDMQVRKLVSLMHFTTILQLNITQGWQCPASDEAVAAAVKTSTRAGPPQTRRTTGS